MALASTGLPCAITSNSSTARANLGEIYGTWDPTYGERHWVYVKNTTGGDLSAGLGVMQKNGTTLFETTLSGANTATVRMLGVAQHTITSNYYGFVLARGCGLVASNGTTTANTAQICAANGQFTDVGASTSDTSVFALETTATPGATVVAKLNCL
jgi:hypothetical protein